MAATEPIMDDKPKRQQRAETSTYVIQTGGDDGAWQDVATVTVPARTKRKRVISEGLAKANITLRAGGTLNVRALSEESAHVSTVEMEQPEPQLRIA